MTEPHANQISVVIPVRNEAGSIDQLLTSLLNQTLAPLEILITDGGSVDGTTDLVEHYVNQGAPVRLIKTAGALPGRGRNLSAAQAAGEWLAFIDGGNRPAPNWLAALAEQAQAAQADVVYGSYEPVIDSFFRECAAIAYVAAPQEIDGKLSRSNFIASTLMRREAWARVGGFPEHLRSAEDLLFMRAVEAANFKTTRAPQAIVYWTIQPNLWRTFKRFVAYSRENVRAGLFRDWQAAIFARYAIVVASLPVALLVGRPLSSLPLVLWLILMILRGAKALRRNRRAYPASLIRNLARLFVVVVIIAAIDAAAFIGFIDWFLRDKVQLYGSKEQHAARG